MLVKNLSQIVGIVLAFLLQNLQYGVSNFSVLWLILIYFCKFRSASKILFFVLSVLLNIFESCVNVKFFCYCLFPWNIFILLLQLLSSFMSISLPSLSFFAGCLYNINIPMAHSFFITPFMFYLNFISSNIPFCLFVVLSSFFFPHSSVSEEYACNAGDPGWEDSLEKEMATHSSILAWRTPRTEEPGRLQSMGSQESDTT